MWDTEAEKRERAAFVLSLRHDAIQDVAVLRAMERVPRALFVEPALRALAYENVALPIVCGQTMSQPGVVAAMTQALSIAPRHRVLEVGTGSGYHASVLSCLAGEVITLERYRSLLGQAQIRFDVLGLRTVSAVFADGLLGLAARAPFDRILLTGAVREVPRMLVSQLHPDGILVAPVGEADGVQTLTRFTRTSAGLTATALLRVRFAPLMPGTAAVM